MALKVCVERSAHPLVNDLPIVSRSAISESELQSVVLIEYTQFVLCNADSGRIRMRLLVE